MKYVTCMGGIWKLTNKQYQKMVIAGSGGFEVDLDEYGKFIGQAGIDITDMEPIDFSLYL